MSSEIYYEKAFISIGDRFIPLVCRGSTNTFEFNVHGCEVAERYWSVLDLPYRGRLLFTSDEIQKIAETIKPFDEELILNETKGKKLVVTYENHGTVNGIGSAVADVLAKNGAGVPLLKLGATEIFGQVGMVDLLKEAYKLTAKDAVAEILKAWHKVN